MVSDLNLKKSWNPRLLKNRAKVWEKERELLSKRREETAIDDAIKEVPAKLNQSKSLRIDWMYNNPAEHRLSADEDTSKCDHLNKLPNQRSTQINLHGSSYIQHSSSNPSPEKPATEINSILQKNDPVLLISKKGSLHRQPHVPKHKNDHSSKITKTRINGRKH
ncbi:hypothetical protein KL942_004089 [Ogataea angusta]|uniref:Pre-mRNA-splicing factor CWC25 n=1 Tax=Pichia angusta TaxID=870730 RepID=A0ABQ7RP86_PICAN|nr:hypothetical protein KL942_004089 [Ogataea angusta]KAG7844966.1 hypothetical protein KL940_005402 [Ogataea angusta]